MCISILNFRCVAYVSISKKSGCINGSSIVPQNSNSLTEANSLASIIFLNISNEIYFLDSTISLVCEKVSVSVLTQPKHNALHIELSSNCSLIGSDRYFSLFIVSFWYQHICGTHTPLCITYCGLCH